jgi:hypothetical protein
VEKIKPFEELTILDNFMFQCVLRNKRICKYMIEKILQIKIRDLHYQDFEKTINMGSGQQRYPAGCIRGRQGRPGIRYRNAVYC